MKNLIITLSIFFALNQFGLAQTLIKDFQLIDIDGNEYTLSDYLNEGKSVVIDISTTWCAPCWKYHEEHHLEKLYQEYGPDGTDEVMVFFIESDPGTGLEQLQGMGTNTQGDWVTGTSYPIIDDHTIQYQFDIIGYPTIITICPNREYTISGLLSTESHYQYIQSVCPKPTVDQDLTFLRLLSDTIINCQSSYTPVIEVMNWNADGTTITDFDIDVSIDGNLSSSINWSGSLPVFHTEVIELPIINDLSPEQEIQYTLQYANDQDTENNTIQRHTTVVESIESSNLLQLNIQTDDNPGQIIWKFTNHNTGETIASGSPPVPNQLNTVNIDFANHLMECIVFSIFDSGNNGNQNDSYYEIIDTKSDTALVVETAPYGNVDYKNFQIVEVVSNQEIEYQPSVEIYPNPSTGQLYISFDNEVVGNDFDLSIYDTMGRLVFQENIHKANFKNQQDIQILKAGTYLLKISNDNFFQIVKLIILDSQ